MAVTINGDGLIQVDGTSTTQGRVRLFEDTDNGTNYVELQAPASLAANLTFTMPSADGTNGQYLQTNGSGTLSFSSVAQYAGPQAQVFTGNGTFTIPTGITRVKVTVVGGGGGGGGSAQPCNFGFGGSGGGGGTAIKWLTGLTPGNTLSVTVGGGGTAGSTGPGNGGAGGNSTVASGTQTITTITGNGGNGGGLGNGTVGSAGVGGSGSNGDVNIIGWALGVQAGGGFSPYSGSVSPTTQYITSGSNIAGNAGNLYGGGGTGGYSSASAARAGGAGAAGVVIFEY